MGVSERLQQLRANFHEHPVRDWLLVAIGAAALVVAVLTLLRSGSGTSTATPVTPTDPGSPVGGGGGSGGGINPIGPTGPIQLLPGPSQPTSNPVTGPVGITPGQWINTVQNATDSQSDPTYGYTRPTPAPPINWGAIATGIKQVVQGQSWHNTAPNATDSQSDPTYGTAPWLASDSQSIALHTAPTLTSTAHAPSGPIQSASASSQLAHRGRGTTGTMQPPTHLLADSEQQPVVQSGAIEKPAKGRR